MIQRNCTLGQQEAGWVLAYAKCKFVFLVGGLYRFVDAVVLSREASIGRVRFHCRGLVRLRGLDKALKGVVNSSTPHLNHPTRPLMEVFRHYEDMM
jgi:hypothetical protein